LDFISCSKLFGFVVFSTVMSTIRIIIF
jgi:hypothetical protein